MTADRSLCPQSTMAQDLSLWAAMANSTEVAYCPGLVDLEPDEGATRADVARELARDLATWRPPMRIVPLPPSRMSSSPLARRLRFDAERAERRGFYLIADDLWRDAGAADFCHAIQPNGE